MEKTRAPIGWKTLPFIGQRVLENELLFSLPWNCLRLDQAWSSSMNDAFKTWRSSSMEAIGTKLIQTGPPPKRLLLVVSSWIHLSCHATGASLVQECGWRHCRLQQLHRYTPLEELEEVSRKEAHLQRGPRDPCYISVTYLLHMFDHVSIMFPGQNKYGEAMRSVNPSLPSWLARGLHIKIQIYTSHLPQQNSSICR